MQHAKVELGFVLFLGMIYHQGCKWGVMKKSETFRIGTVPLAMRQCAGPKSFFWGGGFPPSPPENYEIMNNGAIWCILEDKLGLRSAPDYTVFNNKWYI